MPVKRATVHTTCVACGTPVPLGGVVTKLPCSGCSFQVELDPDHWRWVLEDPPRTAGADERVLGETRSYVMPCSCGAPIQERAMVAAFSASASSIRCADCRKAVPFRVIGAPFSSVAAAVVGAGAPGSGAPAPIDVACTHCGAPLVADGSTQTPTCTYCGTRTVIPDGAWQALHSTGKARPFYVWSLPRASEAALGRPSKRRAWAIAVGATALMVVGATLLAARGHAPGAPGQGMVDGPCSGVQWACSTDGQSQLRCEGDRFVVAISCKGPHGCRVSNDGTAVNCDYTFADVSDPCNVQDDACSTDRRAMLHCDRANFVLSATCKGPDGCTITPKDEGATLTCDDHVADPGDLCKGEAVACASDGKSMLRCRTGRFVAVGACNGPGACKVTKNPGAGTTTIDCDGNVADVGDLCESGHACSSDGKRLLRCENGHFAYSAECPRGCTSAGDNLRCR